MTNKERIADGIARYEESNKRIDAKIKELQEQINELEEEKYQNKIGIGELEGWLLEINEMDGEDPWTW